MVPHGDLEAGSIVCQAKDRAGSWASKQKRSFIEDLESGGEMCKGVT